MTDVGRLQNENRVVKQNIINQNRTEFVLMLWTPSSVLQIRRGNRDNIGTISHSSPFKHILLPNIGTVSTRGVTTYVFPVK